MAKNKTDFSTRVKEVVKRIKAGKTLSYKEVAIRAGNPRASRAVARIMSQNYDPTIPCHRVIRADGGMGGYNVAVRERGTLPQEVVDILDKISYNLNSPCNVRGDKKSRRKRLSTHFDQKAKLLYNLNSPCNGEEIKRKILEKEGVIF